MTVFDIDTSYNKRFTLFILGVIKYNKSYAENKKLRTVSTIMQHNPKNKILKFTEKKSTNC